MTGDDYTILQRQQLSENVFRMKIKAPAVAAERQPGQFVLVSVDADYGERILLRSPNCGCGELSAELAAYLARSRGIVVRPDQIIVGAGSEYLYGLIVQMLGRERIFALEDPSYEKIRLVYEASGVRCEMLPMDREGVRLSALKRSNASVLHVTPFNSYPSGITATASRRAGYIRWAAAADRFIM